ncbi:uncharacterized protein LOC129315796 isoform X2 [Prosopis cineraria]|uniref:uncharacterized protein LOC129315796 isoform X2 n=1 Tax=Prosopis cineraria TaxID=364024 RepID=UPI00240F3006|nr:uncharacterized protein LOC129315796 isoform X2 [Prosopis cineraria]
MTQEDQIQNCDNSYGGDDIGGNCSRPCKKPKQKKIPKRGLGVAQLEKIRVKEQQNKDEAPASPAILSSLSSASSSKSPYLTRSIPNFRHYNQPSSSAISFPAGSPLSLQKVDAKASSTVIIPGHGTVSKCWSSHENDFEKESFGVEPGLVFLPHESNSNSIRPLPKWLQRTQPHEQPSSSMVNASSGTSSIPSLRCSMEPPSNQNCTGHWMPLQPEEKMNGMKRPHSFSLDVPPAPFSFRLPTFAAPMKMNETPSRSGSGFNYAANATNFREAPSSSTSNLEPNSKRRNTENENFNGDFLTLAPPTSTSLCPPSNSKSPSTSIKSLSCQGIIEDQITQLPGFSGLNQMQQPLYNFFPPVAKAKTTARIQNGNEVGENVDLNLKDESRWAMIKTNFCTWLGEIRGTKIAKQNTNLRKG